MNVAEMSSYNVEKGEVGVDSWVCRVFEDVYQQVDEAKHGKVECDSVFKLGGSRASNLRNWLTKKRKPYQMWNSSGLTESASMPRQPVLSSARYDHGNAPPCA